MKNQSLNQTGGHPLTLNDLAFGEGKMNEIATSLSSHAYIARMSGVVLSQNGGTGTWHYSDGWVILFGELYEVVGGDTGLPNATEATWNTFYDVVETVAAPSPITYKNFAVRTVQKNRRAVLGTATTFAPYASVKKYEEVMADVMLSYLREILIATETETGAAEIATQTEVNTGTDDERFVTSKKLKTNLSTTPMLMHVEGGIRLRTKVVEIGDWNMDTEQTVSVPHDLPDFKLIRSAEAVVRNDADDRYYKLEQINAVSGVAGGGVSYFDATNIVLVRKDGGVFDAGIFDTVGYNRGFVTITYIG